MLKKYSLHLLVGLAAGVIVLLPGAAALFFRDVAAFFLAHFDWFTLLLAGAALLACIVVAAGPWGRLRIGGPEARPEYSRGAWLAMLFAAGMGSGLVFWGAAEPLIFTVAPPPGGEEAQSIYAVHEAYALTMFHWGFHAWAIYAVVALAVAYAAYGHDQAPLPSAPFARLPRVWRRLIDWLALLAVVFGVVASLGQGAFQMTSGVTRIAGEALAGPVTTQLFILALLTAVFLTSSLGGIRHGIKPLSNLNVVLAIVLALFVFFVGPTVQIITAMGEMAAAYIQRILPLSVELRAHGAGREWTRDWSLTYLLWWVAWTPFVGVFIARISRGRTIRGFILGVVLVPTLVTLVWFAVLGGTAVHLQLFEGVDLGVTDFATAQAASYVLLEQLPLAMLTQIAAFVLVFIFLVTSADSGAYVMAMFSSETREVPPPAERVFWGLVLSLLTAGAILSEDGQSVTRALAVVGAIPLTFLMVAQAWATGHQIWRDWRAEETGS